MQMQQYNNTILYNIVENIFKKEKIDTLKVMYRSINIDGIDELFGYCTIYKKMNSYSIQSGDGDFYEMSDQIDKFEYKPEYFDGLVVWQQLEHLPIGK